MIATLYHSFDNYPPKMCYTTSSSDLAVIKRAMTRHAKRVMLDMLSSSSVLLRNDMADYNPFWVEVSLPSTSSLTSDSYKVFDICEYAFLKTYYLLHPFAPPARRWHPIPAPEWR